MSQNRIVELAHLDKNPSVHQIRGRMATLLDYYEDKNDFHSLAPFMFVYHRVTSSVADLMIEQEDFFDDKDRLEKLDAEFAELYFSPLREYMTEGEMRRPWRVYFNYCQNKDSRPAIEMLLGINAHINADLLHTLHLQKYDNRSDYQKINTILENQIPASMRYLALKHDIAGLFGLLDRKMAYREFQSLVVNWRENTWNNYQKIKEEDFREHRQEIYDQTEEVAKEVLKLEKDFNYLNLYSTIRKANKLEVKI